MKSFDPFENSEITSILVVEDLEASKSFYQEILEAELLSEYGGNSAVFRFLNHWILLVTGGAPTEDKPDTSFLPIQDKNKVSHSFTIRVDNCKDSYELLIKKGVQFITEPKTHGLETRCFFFDPDGHLFEISEYRQN